MIDKQKLNNAIDTLNRMKALVDMVTVTEEKSDKVGYNFKVTKLGETVLTKEYVVDETYKETDEDGTYLKPYTYTDGAEVTEGMWYTDGDNIWLSLKSGTPTDFSDKEYFDIIEV